MTRIFNFFDFDFTLYYIKKDNKIKYVTKKYIAEYHIGSVITY